jgi:hypothetical protein
MHRSSSDYIGFLINEAFRKTHGTRMDLAIDVEDICHFSSICCFQCHLIVVCHFIGENMKFIVKR